MEVLSASPAPRAFFSRNSHLSVSATTSLPAEDKNSRRFRDGSDSSFKKHDVCRRNSSRYGDRSAVDRKKSSAFFPMNSSRQSAIAEVLQSRDWASAISRLEKKLSVQELNIILRSFGKSKRWSDVSQLFDWMRRHGMTNIASYSSFIKYMGESHNLTRALEVYDSIKDESLKINVSVCNSLLSCMVRERKYESCMKMFEEMKKNGMIPDLFTYSTLLAGCSKLENGYSKALGLVEELESRGLKMDGVIYGSLLAICASNGLCEDAENFFQKMSDEGLSKNVFHYSSMLNVYSAGGDYKKADELIQDMKYAGLVPNKVILTTLLKVYVRSGLTDKSKELLIQLENQGYAEDEIPFCLVMDDLAKKGHVDEAKAIFDKMKEKKIKSDGYSYSIMISAFCRIGRLKEAKELAYEYEITYKKFDLVILNALLRAYCNTGEIESVMNTLKKMDEFRISPDWNTFQILVKYFFKDKLYHLAYKTVEDMHAKGHNLDAELCSSLIAELAKSGAPSEAFSVYNMLRYGKSKPHRSIHEKMLNILIGAKLFKNAYVVMKDNAEDISAPALDKFAFSFMQSGNINMINDVFKALYKSGRGINQEVFHVAVSRYVARPEKEELLLQLLKWMPGQGYTLTSSSVDLILRNSNLFSQRPVIQDILAQKHKTPKTLAPLK